MTHDPNDPFCPCGDCMKVAQAVHDEVVESMKPQKINRLDPAWAMFAAAAMAKMDRDETWGDIADYADAMLRERDRRDREEGE